MVGWLTNQNIALLRMIYGKADLPFYSRNYVSSGLDGNVSPISKPAPKGNLSL